MDNDTYSDGSPVKKSPPKPEPAPIDRSDAADAERFRWLLAGNGYYMEENFLCGHAPTSQQEQDDARRKIDEAIIDYQDDTA